ncbi:MAG: VWA domain-containing protein [Methanomicrobiaceae archaeon]|nr:VWA domain-containing protein [Methanomicrobiaceae archaeon]
MNKYALLAALLILCFVAGPVSAQEVVGATKTVDPDTVYLYDSACTPDMTTVTLTLEGYGGGGVSDTLSVVLAIDSSGSMGTSDSSNLRKVAAKAFADKMLTTPENDKAGVVSWDSNVDFTYGLVEESTDSFGTLKTQIDAVDSSGGTNLNVGLNAAITMLDADASTNKKVIIFLTDGDGTYTYASSNGPAKIAKEKGYVIYSIGLNPPSTAIPKLNDMASATGGTYYSSPLAENLNSIFDAIYAGVASTAPYNVDLVEVTETYIVGEGSFSIAPDSVVENGDGTTTMTWTNVAQYVGNGNDRLDDGETFVVTFTAGSDTLGDDLPVDAAAAEVRWTDPSAGAVSAPMPQAYLDVILCPTQTTPSPVPEFPGLALPIGLLIGILCVVSVLRRP